MRSLAVTVVLLTLAASPLALAAPLPEVVVPAAGFWFLPPALAVPAGTTVTWDGVFLPHTVTTADSLLDARYGNANDAANSDDDADTFHADLPESARFSHTFGAPGVFYYFCELHARDGMIGLIVVQ